ncbi:hypothetical protein HZH68_014664 [Vespula germanica]|uniref:Uncharacterized protein n=1 Tax=Vespula germanica TaxID=30212 RepID=A0A834JB11_VESGE|nr:hypothetical protein HZH68_014664 [Vespula germanica]
MCILSVNCQQAVLSNGPAIIVYQHCITNRNGATSKGQVSLEDNERSKHPTSSLSDENMKKIRDLLKTDRYFSCRGIAEELNISISLRRSPESFEEEKSVYKAILFWKKSLWVMRLGVINMNLPQNDKVQNRSLMVRRDRRRCHGSVGQENSEGSSATMKEEGFLLAAR